MKSQNKQTIKKSIKPNRTTATITDEENKKLLKEYKC